MRENTKWIMLITALAFGALMVFEWGMDLSGRSASAAAGGELGSVNGEPITADEYNTVYRNLYQQQSAQLGDQPITAAMNRQIEEAAWDQLITSKLLEQEMRRRGVRVTDAEILQAAQYAPPPELINNPLFQTDGQFDLAKYQQFITSNLDDQTLAQLEAYYREIIPRSKLYFETTAGVTVSDGALWRMYRDANEQAQVRFISVDPAAIVPESEIDVTDAAVRQYHEEHRDDFIRPARASVKYLVVDRTPTASDSAAALQTANDARARIAGGATFDAVARELAVDTTSPAQRTSIRIVRNGQQFPPAFEEAAFSAPTGQLSQPLLTQFGYHVMRVDSRAGDTATVSQVLVPVELSQEREDALFARADSLDDLSEDYRLEEIGRRLGLAVQTADLAPPLAFIPGVGTADDGIDWALREGEPGDVSGVFESAEAFYMLELVSRQDEGTMTLEETTPAIRTILARRQQIEKAREQLRDVVNNARQAGSIDAAAERFGTTVQTAGPFSRGDFVPGMGRLNAAIGAAFGLQRGRISDLVEAEGRLFLIQLENRTEANRAEWEKQLNEQRGRVVQTLADERWQQYLAALRKSAQIVDRRAEQAEAVRRLNEQAEQLGR